MRRTGRRAAMITAGSVLLSATAQLGWTALAGARTAAGTARAAAARPATGGYVVRQILVGGKLSHTYTAPGKTGSRTEHLSGPDDITTLGQHLFAAFQNGVGPQGQASRDGNTASTIVEFTKTGQVIHQWDIAGKCDGLAGDPLSWRVIATVNEDGKSSVYTISPAAPPLFQLNHFNYGTGLPHNGGTDAVSVYHGVVLISASAPGTTGRRAPQPSYPAVYRVTFNSARKVAAINPVFWDESPATLGNAGGGRQPLRLRLTDPDSGAVVPQAAARFAGDFMLTSQGDRVQVYARYAIDNKRRHLVLLRLSQAVDDTAWAVSRAGQLFATDSVAGSVDTVSGRFPLGQAFVAATPCAAAKAPARCPARPRFPPNYLGALDPRTGSITKVALTGPWLQPSGLIFLPVH